jgi:hypothetical protein
MPFNLDVIQNMHDTIYTPLYQCLKHELQRTVAVFDTSNDNKRFTCDI